MKRFFRGILAVIIGITMMVPLSSTPTFAADLEPCSCYDSQGNKTGDGTKPPTAILNESACDCGHGEAIISILNLVVNIMTIGVGILGVIGITLVGIQYLTAGGSEEKTRKAKRRMFEIIVGIVVYVIVYSLLNWFIPSFKPLGS